MTAQEKIKRLLVKFDCLSPNDKKEIKALCAEAGLPVFFKTGCPDCYRDALVLLRDHYGVDIPEKVEQTKSGRYEYVGEPGAVIYIHGEAVRLGPDLDDDTIKTVLLYNPTLYREKK